MTSRFIDHGRCRCALVPAKPWRAPFTADEIRAAEIEAAREEGRLAGLAYAAECARETQMMLLGGTTASALISAQALGSFAGGIEDALKEARHADA